MEGETSRGSQEQDCKKLKHDLMNHRALVLFLNKIIEWEPIHIPGIVIGVITLLFVLIWYIEPSILTLFSLLGLVFVAVDFVSPYLSDHFYRLVPGQTTQWSQLDRMTDYDRTCSRILNGKKHITTNVNTLFMLKRDKPQIYMLTVVGVLVLLAWIGSLIDNLLLLYLIVIFVVLIPGLRKHGIIQKVTSKIPDLKSKLQKTKSN